MKTTEFLKKFSVIDISFINDFYTFYDEGKDEYDFTINLELIAKWLDVQNMLYIVEILKKTGKRPEKYSRSSTA
jgi:hypothetical protein